MEEYDILQCVDRGLDHFGSHIKQTIYWQITILHGSLHNAIVSNPQIFVTVLRRIFGDGVVAVETVLVEELGKSFDLRKHDAEDLALALKAASEQITPNYSMKPLQMMAK